MHKRMLREKGPYNRVTLWPLPLRFDDDGVELAPMDDVWLVMPNYGGRLPYIQNERTHHCAELIRARYRGFDHLRTGADGIVFGHYRLDAQLVLSGCNVFYSMDEYLEARRSRPQIFLPVARWHGDSPRRLQWSDRSAILAHRLR